MSAPLSIRLDEQVRATLTAEAETRGIGLSAYLRQLAEAEAEAKRLFRARIRADNDAVARFIAASPEALAFCEDWGSAEVFGLNQ